MKKINIIAICLSVITLMTSCDKFLELTPRDQKVVSTVEDYRDILASYMKFIKTPNPSQMMIMGIGSFTFPYFNVSTNLGVYTGETNLDTKSSVNFDKATNQYHKEAINMMTWLKPDEYIWNQYYEFLGGINLVIKGISTATGDNEDLRNYVMGEALVWRAFGYYKLLQYYSPYKNNEYGIPVYLTPDENIGTAMPKRETQEHVFKQILGDCQHALTLLETTPTNDWNCAYRYDFINAMMASIYTWKAGSGAAEATDWSNAAKCATEAMQGRQLTNSVDEIRQMFDCYQVTMETFMVSDEFYFRIMDGDNRCIMNLVDSYYECYYLVDGRANPDYYNKFMDGDIRKEAYFSEDGALSDKYNLIGASDGGCLIPFRLAEMYLIKAEALARQGNLGEAASVLRQFKQARYTGDIEVPTGEKELMREILDERLREFYMENDFRWLDMKRLGVKVTRTVQGERHVLEPDDFRYTFPIPNKEMEINKSMKQAPGWENVII